MTRRSSSIRRTPRAFNNRGSARSDKGDTDAAIADFDAALKLDARFASAYFNRANAYAAKGETARAIADYSKAIAVQSAQRERLSWRAARCIWRAARPPRRAPTCAQALALDRRNAYAVLWHEIAERRAKQKGVLAGGKGLKDIEMNGWPAPVLHMFVGELKADGVLVAADDANAATQAGAYLRGEFLSGQYALIGGNREEAAKLFRAAAKECPHGFIEGIMAAAS